MMIVFVTRIIMYSRRNFYFVSVTLNFCIIIKWNIAFGINKPKGVMIVLYSIRFYQIKHIFPVILNHEIDIKAITRLNGNDAYSFLYPYVKLDIHLRLINKTYVKRI